MHNLKDMHSNASCFPTGRWAHVTNWFVAKWFTPPGNARARKAARGDRLRRRAQASIGRGDCRQLWTTGKTDWTRDICPSCIFGPFRFILRASFQAQDRIGEHRGELIGRLDMQSKRGTRWVRCL
jgi:hypothetical protein